MGLTCENEVKISKVHIVYMINKYKRLNMISKH